MINLYGQKMESKTCKEGFMLRFSIFETSWKIKCKKQ